MFGTGLGVYIPIVLYIAFWMSVVASILWKPSFGLYLCIVISPLQTIRERLWDYPFGKNTITILLAAVILGCLVRGYGFRRTPLSALLLVLVVYLYVSVWIGTAFLPWSIPLWFSDPRLSQLKDYFMLPFLYFALILSVRDVRQIKTVLLCCLFATMLVCRSAFLEIVIRDFSHFSEEKRTAAALGYAGANGLAAFLAQYSLFLIGWCAYEKTRLRKWLLWFVSAFAAGCMVYTFSRGAYLGFLFGLAVFGAIKNRIVLVLLLVFLVFWQAIVPLPVQERVLMTYEKSEGLDESAESRVTVWGDAIDLFMQDPVFGTGHSTYQFLGRVGHLRDTHNWYLKVLVENGIVGLVIYLALIGKMLGVIIRLAKTEALRHWRGLGLGLLLCLSCALVSNLFGDRWTYIEVNGLFWVLLGCACLVGDPEFLQPPSEPDSELLGELRESESPVGATI